MCLAHFCALPVVGISVLCAILTRVSQVADRLTRFLRDQRRLAVSETFVRRLLAVYLGLGLVAVGLRYEEMARNGSHRVEKKWLTDSSPTKLKVHHVLAHRLEGVLRRDRPGHGREAGDEHQDEGRDGE